MDKEPSLFQLIIDVKQQISVLALSGVAGAFFRAVIAPEKEVLRRIVQGVAGAISAIFLGGIVGYMIDKGLDAGVYAYLASGFIMGSGGEVAVKKLQDKILGRED